MQTPTLPQKLAFSIREACELLSLGRSRVYQELKAGRLRFVKVGGRTLIPEVELRAWLERMLSPLKSVTA
jgi:excisionase family DNA binding protein